MLYSTYCGHTQPDRLENGGAAHIANMDGSPICELKKRGVHGK
jgi:hypothetical protein